MKIKKRNFPLMINFQENSKIFEKQEAIFLQEIKGEYNFSPNNRSIKNTLYG